MSASLLFNKEIIIDAAYRLTKKYGLHSLTARDTAAEAGCSTHPIYKQFKELDEVKQLVSNRVAQEFKERLIDAPYKYEFRSLDYASAWSHYAMDEPHLYMTMFNSNALFSVYNNKNDSETLGSIIINAFMEDFELTYDEALELYLTIVMHIQGLLSLLEYSVVPYTYEQMHTEMFDVFYGKLKTLRSRHNEQ